MTDTLAGVQRHSTSAFWSPYVVISLAGSNMDSDMTKLRIMSGIGKDLNKAHAEFTVYEKGQPRAAILVQEDDCDWWLEQCINMDAKIGHLWTVSRPGTDQQRTRTVHNMQRQCLGVLKDFGQQGGTRFRNDVVFYCKTQKRYFVPSMTGWLQSEPRGGSYTVAVNPKSDGARYHDYRNQA